MATDNEELSGPDETPPADYVPCEACGLYVPPQLATLLPLDGCYVCNACVRAKATQPAEPHPLRTRIAEAARKANTALFGDGECDDWFEVADAIVADLQLELMGYISPNGSFEHYVDVTSDEEWMAEWPDDRRVYAVRTPETDVRSA